MKTIFKTILTESELRKLIREELQAVLNNEVVEIAASKDEGFITLTQACEYLKMSRSTMYKLTMAKEIPFHKSGKRVLFKKSELAEWIKK